MGASFGGDVRSQVVAIYQRVDPSKLDKVDQFLAKYKGREGELLAQLHKKYAGKLGLAGPPPASFGEPTRLGGGAPTFAAPQTSSFASYSNLGTQFGAPSNLGAGFAAAATTPPQQPFGAAFSPPQQQTSFAAPFAGQGGGFGATSTSPFQQQPFQQQQQPASVFGGGAPPAQSSSFGQPAAPAQSSSFGQSASVFGAQSSPSTFGAVSQQQASPFGQPTSAFGNSPSFTQMRG